MSWLVISIVLSLVLTAILNVALRVFPDAGGRIASAVARPPSADADATRSDARIRVWAPWKAMIVGSVVLTVLLNVVLWSVRR